MKKVFLYHQLGYEFFTCYYEGLDDEGIPRLTIMTPGCPVQNLLQYLKNNGDKLSFCNLLCEEGKPADPKLIVEMLGQIFLNSLRPYERMYNILREIRLNGIHYEHELQKMTVKIFEMVEAKSKIKGYRLLIYVDGQERLIGESNLFSSISEIFIGLRAFFFFMESQVQIPLKKKLEMSESLKKHSKRIADIFDEIVV